MKALKNAWTWLLQKLGLQKVEAEAKAIEIKVLGEVKTLELIPSYVEQKIAEVKVVVKDVETVASDLKTLDQDLKKL